MFKSLFYRYVDTEGSEEGELLKEIEMRIFRDVVKPEFESESEDWIGSKIQNKSADWKVASIVRQSFKTYEKGKSVEYENSFFNF